MTYLMDYSKPEKKKEKEKDWSPTTFHSQMVTQTSKQKILVAIEKVTNSWTAQLTCHKLHFHVLNMFLDCFGLLVSIDPVGTT